METVMLLVFIHDLRGNIRSSDHLFAKASISLACKFIATVSRIQSRHFRETFVRVSHECRENFDVSQTSRELVAKVSNMFKNFMRKSFRQNISQDCRTTVVRRSRDVRASVANLLPRNFGEFTMRKFRDTRTNVVRVSHDGRATVLRQHAKNSRLSGEKIKLSDIRTNVV